MQSTGQVSQPAPPWLTIPCPKSPQSPQISSTPQTEQCPSPPWHRPAQVVSGRTRLDKLEQNYSNYILRGRLHVYESMYESLFDSVHDLLPMGLGFFIIYRAHITTVCKLISEKIDPKFDFNPPLAPNRTPNSSPIRMQIRTCGRPLGLPNS
jgi:hypothetical protein